MTLLGCKKDLRFKLEGVPKLRYSLRQASLSRATKQLTVSSLFHRGEQKIQPTFGCEKAASTPIIFSTYWGGPWSPSQEAAESPEAQTLLIVHCSQDRMEKYERLPVPATRAQEGRLLAQRRPDKVWVRRAALPNAACRPTQGSIHLRLGILGKNRSTTVGAGAAGKHSRIHTWGTELCLCMKTARASSTVLPSHRTPRGLPTRQLHARHMGTQSEVANWANEQM